MPSSPANIIVLSAPSGAGKTTVAKHLLQAFPRCVFSVSATTRAMRPGEQNGRDYHFLSTQEFTQRIQQGDLLEYEQIFDNYYGTLRSETLRRIQEGRIIIFDVDVKGALSLRQAFPDESLLLYIAPPSLEILGERLRNRGTETEQQIALRLSRAEMEMEFRAQFDHVLINDNLQETLHKAETLVKSALS
jgi:guanylate kinase